MFRTRTASLIFLIFLINIPFEVQGDKIGPRGEISIRELSYFEEGIVFGFKEGLAAFPGKIKEVKLWSACSMVNQTKIELIYNWTLDLVVRQEDYLFGYYSNAYINLPYRENFTSPSHLARISILFEDLNGREYYGESEIGIIKRCVIKGSLCPFTCEYVLDNYNQQ